MGPQGIVDLLTPIIESLPTMSRDEALRQLSSGAQEGSAAWNAYYGPSGYYNAAPSVQAASPVSSTTAPVPPAVSNPTYTQNEGYNPLQYASNATAQQVANLTGGGVRTETYPGSMIPMPSMNYITGLGPDDMNAGLLADALSKYSPEYVARTYGIPVGSLPAGGAFASQLAAAGRPSPTPDYVKSQPQTPYAPPQTQSQPTPQFTNTAQTQQWPYMNMNGFVPQAQYMQNQFQQAFPGYTVPYQFTMNPYQQMGFGGFGGSPFGMYGNYGMNGFGGGGYSGNSLNFPTNVYGSGYNFMPSMFGMNNQGSQAGAGVGVNAPNYFSQPRSNTMSNFASLSNYTNPSFMGGAQGNQYNPYGRMNYGGYTGQGFNYR